MRVDASRPLTSSGSTRNRPPSKRALWIAGVGIAAMLGAVFYLTAFTRYGDSMREREVVAQFDHSAPRAQRDAVRQACGDLPAVDVVPPGPGTLRSIQLNDVRFRVDNASPAQLNALYQCLRVQPGVVGFRSPQDAM